jgi:hypothetical protein
VKTELGRLTDLERKHCSDRVFVSSARMIACTGREAYNS